MSKSKPQLFYYNLAPYCLIFEYLNDSSDCIVTITNYETNLLDYDRISIYDAIEIEGKIEAIAINHAKKIRTKTTTIKIPPHKYTIWKDENQCE